MPHFKKKKNHLCKLPSKTNIAISVFILRTPLSLFLTLFVFLPQYALHIPGQNPPFFSLLFLQEDTGSQLQTGHSNSWRKEKKGGVGKFSGATNVFVERSPNLEHVENFNINWRPLVCPSGPFHLTFLFTCCGLRTWGSSDPAPPPPNQTIRMSSITAHLNAHSFWPKLCSIR